MFLIYKDTWACFIVTVCPSPLGKYSTNQGIFKKIAMNIMPLLYMLHLKFIIPCNQ